MPLNKSIKKVLVIGSGPIIIGQAAEFDYSGTQACHALMEEGVEVVLVNSNPATIMTDREVASKVYIEPITRAYLEKIIEKERPDSLLAGMGGQTALNMALELHESGVLERYGVKLIGTAIDGIMQGEDRALFKEMMQRIGEPMIQSEIASTVSEGMAIAETIGYPVIVRPAYTLGGTGGGIASSAAALEPILMSGIEASPVNQVLIEKSIAGWKEIEYEVMRDARGNKISVCNMENFDPVGIHTGDSIVVAPSQTLSDKEYQMLRTSALKIIEAIKIEGGCNVQFALNPKSFEYAVIEINPRVSRSSALASKATGYPIAKVAAKIALGYGLDEIKNAVTGVTYACFEPSLDYVVVKIPKWPFDKFHGANRTLGTKMMATGEIMAIGSNFEAAFLKGIRSLELGQYHLKHKKFMKFSTPHLRAAVMKADDERLFALAELIRREYRADKISEITGIDPWFIKKLQGIVDDESALEVMKLSDLDRNSLKRLKKKGFSDKALADLLSVSPEAVYQYRVSMGILPVYHRVDTCGGEFEAITPYYYSSYESTDEVSISDRKKVVVLGSGPIRIGQGIEFDYASVHCVMALKKMGYEAIIINSNPETVSTDFSIADRLYFEPLTEEDVLNIIDKEKPEGVILQFGGQTAIKLASFIDGKGIKVFGTSYSQIDEAENREKFDQFLETLQVDRPKGNGVTTIEEGFKLAEALGFPVLVRPSYVLGGQGMKVCAGEEELHEYLRNAFIKDKKNPVLIDKYLDGREIEVDAISDGDAILIPGIMEHIERAGVHSGDSMTVYPPQNLTPQMIQSIVDISEKIATGLKVKGMINIQFIESAGKIYVIEVNPRASRTVPYISKMSGLPVIEIATRLSMGERLKDLPYGTGLYPEPAHVAVKVPVFSTHKLPDVEISLGPEMRSTGEVLGVGRDYAEALYKGLIAAKWAPQKSTLRIAMLLNDADKQTLTGDDYMPSHQYVGSEGTAKLMTETGFKVERVIRTHDEMITLIKNGEVDLIVNTPTVGDDTSRSGFTIRRVASERNIPVYTSLDTYRAWCHATKNIASVEDTMVYELM